MSTSVVLAKDDVSQKHLDELQITVTGLIDGSVDHQSKADEQQDHPDLASNLNPAKASVANIVSVPHYDLKSDLHHQPRVSDHRGENVPSNLQGGKPKVSVQNERGVPQDPQRRSLTAKSVRSIARDGHESFGSSESDRSESIRSEKGRGGDDEDDQWDIFLDDMHGAMDNDLVETNPLYEMANVDVDVEESLAEMEEALRRSLEQARVSDRERTILLDKFSLFLQALVSFQENEVELIDNIGMKVQITEVLQTFIVDETKTTALMIAEQKKKDQQGEFGGVDSITVGEDEADEMDDLHRGAVAIDEMDATAVRENLLMQKNKLEMQEQMKMIHLLEIKQLEFEKTLLTMHYSKMIKPSDLQKELRDLRKAITDMKIEIGSMQQESAQFQLDISYEEKILREEEAEINQLDLDTLTKQIEVGQNSTRPLQLAKDADREAHRLEQVQDTLEALEEGWLAGLLKYKILQTRIEQKTSEYGALLKEETRVRQVIKLTHQENNRMILDSEALQKKEQTLLNKSRITIEKIAYNVKLKRKLYEEHHVIHNDTIRAQREYQKLERTVKIASDAHLNAKLAYEKMRSAFETVQPKGDSENWEKLQRMFLHEIESLKVALTKKLAEASVSANTVARLQKKLNILYEEQLQCGKELQDQMRTTVQKRRERQNKAEQCVKLEAQLFALGSDVRLKKADIDDCGRTQRDLNRSLTIIQKKYSQVKIEKSAVASDLIQARQRIAEQVEKFKIAHNEVESYINQSLDRTKQISRIHYLLLNAGLARDSVRNSALRAVQKFRFHRIERDELKMANNNNRKEVFRLRKDVAEVRRRFQAAIESSSKIAISVRERTEEVCTFVEKIRVFDMILLQGTAELRLREMEKSKLISTLNEAKTHLIIVTANQPDETDFVEKVERLRSETNKVTKERRDLENELSNITGPTRVREIHHNWLEEREKPRLVRKKIHKLEGLLAAREIRVLERDLAMKQLDELTEASIENANWLKQKFSCEFQVYSNMRKGLQHISNKIDGMICETSLASTRARCVEHEYVYVKQELKKAERRFELGFPPTRDIEKDWNHNVWQCRALHQAGEKKQKFLVEKPRPRGSAVVMERLRPKPKPDTFTYQPLPVAVDLSLEKFCPKFPYNPTKRKLNCIKPVSQRLKTGIRFCHR